MRSKVGISPIHLERPKVCTKRAMVINHGEINSLPRPRLPPKEDQGLVTIIRTTVPENSVRLIPDSKGDNMPAVELAESNKLELIVPNRNDFPKTGGPVFNDRKPFFLCEQPL